jgi:hypothetical protein
MMDVLQKTVVNGVTSESVTEYADWYQALANYHSILSSAYTTEGLSYVLVMLINDSGNVDKQECFSIVMLTYDANGGTGSVAPVKSTVGYPIDLSDGTGLTAPTGKEFAGWATSASATEPDIASPLAIGKNTTIYAVWVDET